MKHYERGWSEVLKITEAPALIHAGLYHLELDGRQVGTVNVFSGCLDAIRAALEETPEAAYLLEEQGREIATLVKRLAKAELLIERLKDIAESALRTAEESSVVGLIDSTPAKQSPNAANADGDWDSVIDGEVEE